MKDPALQHNLGPASALVQILTKSRRSLVASISPELIEQASDEALSVSMDLAKFASQLRQVRARVKAQAVADGLNVGDQPTGRPSLRLR